MSTNKTKMDIVRHLLTCLTPKRRLDIMQYFCVNCGKIDKHKQGLCPACEDQL